MKTIGEKIIGKIMSRDRKFPETKSKKVTEGIGLQK